VERTDTTEQEETKKEAKRLITYHLLPWMVEARKKLARRLFGISERRQARRLLSAPGPADGARRAPESPC